MNLSLKDLKSIFKDKSNVPSIEELKAFRINCLVKGRSLENTYSPFSEATQSAVIFTFFQDFEGRIMFPLIKRKSNPNDAHSGQISLPGGKRERDDFDLQETAKREQHEEIGIPKDLVEIVGNLEDLYIDVSNFLVKPFVAIFAKGMPDFELETEEVDGIILVDLEVLNQSALLKYADIKVRGLTLQKVPYFLLGGHIVWGATCMMINDLRWRLFRKID